VVSKPASRLQFTVQRVGSRQVNGIRLLAVQEEARKGKTRADLAP